MNTFPFFRRQPGERPFVLGHRGARADAPENTMRAFELALTQGADGLEIDVRMSADGELFIAHDPALHVNGHQAPVPLAELTSAQISRLRLPSGEPIPRLGEVLELQKSTGTRLNVELKGDVQNPLWMAERTARWIRRHGGSGILFSSFHPWIVASLARLLPEIPTGLLIEEEQTIMSRWAPYRLLGAVAVHPQASLVTEERVAKWKRQGALINVWTVNKPSEAWRLADLGVDAIITDAPARILQSW